MNLEPSADPKSFSEIPTRWSMILNGQDSGATWKHLLERYRGAVIAWVRRRLKGHPEANDIALDFFSYLYSQKLLAKADPARGRFRFFLQGVLKNFLRMRMRPALIASGFDEAALDRAIEPEDAIAEAEEADWARRVLHNACKELLRQKPRDGEILLRYYGIKPFAHAEVDEICDEFGLNRNALDQARFAARKKLRELIEKEVRETTNGDPEAFAEEFALLAARLRSTNAAMFGSS
ncbi:MAG: sigma-70 family RNA polymerase sigma factor [Planctomycetes bacterium]|nr:sigma-70 family RNA polymerase sigma factor [Planctomycetota bacterium]